MITNTQANPSKHKYTTLNLKTINAKKSICDFFTIIIFNILPFYEGIKRRHAIFQPKWEAQKWRMLKMRITQENTANGNAASPSRRPIET